MPLNVTVIMKQGSSYTKKLEKAVGIKSCRRHIIMDDFFFLANIGVESAIEGL